MMRDQQIDVKNGLGHYDFIRNVVVEKIEGIRLRPIKEETLLCMACEAVYVRKTQNHPNSIKNPHLFFA
jgi:hypothetical protein